MWESITKNVGYAVTTLSLIAVLWPPAAPAQTWEPLGPAPMLSGQTEGIVDNPVVGAIHALAPHPTDADILYIGSVNGGIWRTSSATDASPSWAQQTDEFDSLSIGDIAFDPTDAQHRTVVAGVGRFSSYGRRGGSRSGLYRTTDDGASWNHVGSDLQGLNVTGVAPRGAIIVVAVNRANSNSCSDLGLFRSTDTGATFAQARLVNEGIPAGRSFALAGDPADSVVLYASIIFGDVCDGGSNGIYKSVDTGATWVKVSDAAVDAFITNDTTVAIEIAVGYNNNVFVAVANSGRLAAIFRSGDGGASWDAMDLPMSDLLGIHPGGQASIHMSLAADPNDDDVVYVGGDRQPLSNGDTGGFPNSIGARNFSGRLFRGDAGEDPGSQWDPLTHDGTDSGSAPHADSRDLAFDADGDLLEADDGGVYVRTSPNDATGDWFDRNGNLQITEAHSTLLDTNSDIVVTGNQDNGTSRQDAFSSRVWRVIQGGDGGDVAVDLLTGALLRQSTRYVSFQRLDLPRRLTYDENNIFLTAETLQLALVSGDPLETQFTTPIAVNQVAPDRLIIGGDNSVYESLDQGDTIAEIGPGIETLANGRDAIGYGAAGNEDVLYVGAVDGVYVRATQSGPLALSVADSDVQGLALSSFDPSLAFYVSSNNVYETSDTGGEWRSIRGNLDTTATGTLRSVLYAQTPAGVAVIVGSDRGVYRASPDNDYATWDVVGDSLPNAPIFELAYDAARDILIAGTLGRGVLSLTPLLGDPNLPPSAQNDEAATNEGTLVVINVLDNDADTDGSLDVESVTVTIPPADGLAEPQPDGTIHYTPDGGFDGQDVFEYTVLDDDGAVSNAAMVTIAVNDSPIAVPDMAETNEATPVIVAVLENDQDSDGLLDPGSVEVTRDPDDGVVEIPGDGTLIYTPIGGFSGEDSFDYRVRDELGAESEEATVTIDVNDSPVANDDNASTTRGVAVAIAVLDNDVDSDGTLESDSLAIVESAENGALEVDTNSGLITYTPDAAFAGFDRFTYRASDDDGAPSNVAQVLVAVFPGPAAPMAMDDEFYVDPGEVYRGDVSGNDADPDGDPLVYTLLQNVASGNVKLSASGSFTYSPLPGFIGIDTFRYQVSDGAQSDTATVTLDVGDLIFANGFD